MSQRLHSISTVAGTYPLQLAARGRRVTGVDVAPPMLDEAARFTSRCADRRSS